MKKHPALKYTAPAEDSMEGWEKYSLPVGNGFGGASVFGGVAKERIQFTTNEFANDYKNGGVSNFAELYIRANHDDVQNYERGLDLSTGTVYSRYQTGEKKVEREAFFSYPNRVFAYKIQVEKGKDDFEIQLVIPYLCARSVEEGGRTGSVSTEKNRLIMRGTLPARDLRFVGIAAVESDGEVSANGESLSARDASWLIVYFAFGTSYKLCPQVFFDGEHKALGDDPYAETEKRLLAAEGLGYEKVYALHIADYAALMGRTSIDLGGKEDGRTTEELLASVQNGNREPYLEEVYFTFGRHLLVSSSRKGSLPASLQGVWSAYDKSPWGSGFWHNINVQMNYWPALSCNLAETFSAYADYFKAYLPQAQKMAREWIMKCNPENYGDGNCGWVIGTGAFAYEIEGLNGNTHSGPGTGALTAKLFWDYYDFTRDEKAFEEYTLPAVHGMSQFLTKCVRDYNGEYLCSFSASPEQILSGEWVHEHAQQQYYHTVGCTFDQQMIYENAVDDIACARISGVEDETVKTEKMQRNAYLPVRIGYDGQIKEYGEEHFYGEIGEAKHRHISQLVGLMPGSTITRDTPAWLDGAKITLRLRGDKSTGWALAHRMCAWTRTGDGNHAYALFRELLKNRTHPNLWDVHPPFQIDGNFGATAGIAEMLLQSHGGQIEIMPALPKEWSEISFKGLKARGNFTVSASLQDGKITCEITSNVGGKLRLAVERGDCIEVTDKDSGEKISFVREENVVHFSTQVGRTYRILGMTARKEETRTPSLRAEWTEEGVRLSWTESAGKYLVLRAVGDESGYTELGTVTETTFLDEAFGSGNKARITYKVIGFEDEKPRFSADGGLAVLHPADELEVERYKLRFRVNNLNIK